MVESIYLESFNIYEKEEFSFGNTYNYNIYDISNFYYMQILVSRKNIMNQFKLNFILDDKIIDQGELLSN